jgi:uncharacterized FAD-dependent dehydrogenase
MRIRATFPQVYELEHPKNGTYWLVSARRTKWGMKVRKVFSKKELAIKHAQSIEEQLVKFGGQADIPKGKIQLADRYQELIEKLAGFGKSPEDAVNHYAGHLGNEIVRQARPYIRDLVDQWEKFKNTDTTLSKKFLVDIRSYPPRTSAGCVKTSKTTD